MPYSNRVFKKHSVIIARLALRAGYITQSLYNDLYFASFRQRRRKRKSHKNRYWSLNYYDELYYCTVDYWGEADEHSLIRTVIDTHFWGEAKVDEVTGEILPRKKSYRLSNISMMRILRDSIKFEKLCTKQKKLRITKNIKSRKRKKNRNGFSIK